jgi:hypothetical protein
MKTMARLLPILLTLLSLPLAGHKSHAVNPPPDGGYPGNNTAEGQNALLSLTTGVNNTAVGWFSLKSDRNGQLNTAVGAATLFSTVQASRNTAIGGAALFSNTAGGQNTAVGALALFHNTNADLNTAIGDSALVSNTVGSQNTAVGGWALVNNNTGNANVAIGSLAAYVNFTGGGNTAVGEQALSENQSGNYNIALGFAAGERTTGSNNIVIGDVGVAGESNTIRIGGNGFTGGPQTAAFIAGISGTAVVGDAVVVDGNGQLGTVASSARFKKNIKPMDKASEVIIALKPVTFHYKKEIDPNGLRQFGLVAEEVEKIAPDLVRRDRDGKLQTVRYDAVNAMLLNEFLREHQKVEKLEATVSSLVAMVKEQAAQLQRVSAQLELSKAAPQTVVNHQ